jgi:pantetheine-phosphate adenylyltransferase
MAHVAVGGSFDPLHDGHKVLLGKACELSRNGELLIGLTSDEMVKKKGHKVRDYKSRLSDVRRFILAQGIDPAIVRLDEPYGPTVNDDFDFIVVSPETLPGALKINEIREKKALRHIKIVLVDYVLAQDGFPISSTRIAKGEIDEHGNILRE